MRSPLPENSNTLQQTKENETMLIGIPSTHPGGMEAAFGAHFGHCDLYNYSAGSAQENAWSGTEDKTLENLQS
ncbi:MAG: hypothetical protein L3J49_13640 [Desulfobulbaceae bacterium]|nr:hypothetical protein [Desulfobulbaceae bacterium]